jgi:hypothetical protein
MAELRLEAEIHGLQARRQAKGVQARVSRWAFSTSEVAAKCLNHETPLRGAWPTLSKKRLIVPP